MNNAPRLPFNRGSDTSEAAAETARERAVSDRLLVLDFIRSRGAFGATDDEVEVALGFRHETASARRNGLVRSRLVRDSGLRRLTRRECPATVWVACSPSELTP